MDAARTGNAAILRHVEEATLGVDFLAASGLVARWADLFLGQGLSRPSQGGTGEGGGCED